MKLIKPNRQIVEVTEKAYKVLYKARGWRVYEGNKEPVKDDTDLQKLTKKELLDKADKLGVNVNSSMTKSEIIEVLEV